MLKKPACFVEMNNKVAKYHLPGLFEFYEFYKVFIPIFYEHREYFYDWCDIGSIYGAPAGALWGGGRVGYGEANPNDVLSLMHEYEVSPRLTFSNSLLEECHLSDGRCNKLCSLFAGDQTIKTGIVIHSDLLLDYLKQKYPMFYFVSSTTKVITNFDGLLAEVDRKDFQYVVSDFRLNKSFDRLERLSQSQKEKLEFLCNECCPIACTDRKACYENVSRKSLGEDCPDHRCIAENAAEGYKFSKAMESPCFIGIDDIQNKYITMGFSNFKIEGRSLGSAIILEMLLYYMAKPESHLKIREKIYLNSTLDLF